MSEPVLALRPLPTAGATLAPEPAVQAPESSPLVQKIDAAIASGTSVDVLTKTYLALRDKKKELDTAAKGTTAPLTLAMAKLEAHFLAQCDTLGVDSLKNVNGTPYVTTTSSITCADGDVFVKFLLDQALNGLPLKPEIRDNIVAHMMRTGALALLETRPAKGAIEAFVESTKEYPPGLNVNRTRGINVRK